ncbi:MAG: transposase family protein [Gammaproteobacteria bacterium]|nr:transposase family protein [Gammaproteobacteria bacterium]
MITDQGTNYMSELFKVVCDMFQIKHSRTSPYHPQTDGVSERFGRTLIGAISHFVNEGMTDWDDKLPIIMFALRNTNHSATNEIPYFAMFGRDARMPNIAHLHHPNPKYVDVSNFLTGLLINLRDTWAGVQRQLEISFQASKHYQDKTANTTANDWKVGDKVFIKYEKPLAERLTKKRLNVAKSRKFLPKWRGPYRIIKVFHPNVKVVPLFAPHTWAKTLVVNVCRLKPFRGEWIPDIESDFRPPHESVADEIGPTIPTPPTKGASLDISVAPRVAMPKNKVKQKKVRFEDAPPIEQILQEALGDKPPPKEGSART